MVSRSKSFNMNNPYTKGTLNSWKSSPDLSSYFIDRLSLNLREVSPQEALNSVKQIKMQIERDKWQYVPEKNEKLDEEQKKWNNRCYCAVDMFETGLNVIQDIRFDSKHEYNCIIAYFRGSPVGVLILSYTSDLSDSPEIVVLVTHCGLKGGGALLIEYAVNKSKELGRSGKLKMLPLGDAQNVFLNMGFVDASSGDIELNPAESNKWYIVQGKYRFHKSFGGHLSER
ncbi:hypothetical protein PSI23_02870 [Xenorhabdus sp. XENO-10]|uniref:N-acetyltransferase n=1 Tax=Xenorhabdus yunnanensis TaxID=3025878 RepID=A0ABT5LCR4_9GAMM|nr:hypothetical protein [Xenorhabdus yunnanensis]MDC9588283.1 hypothetical protein [Xenorhabdus yunnanensis]